MAKSNKQLEVNETGTFTYSSRMYLTQSTRDDMVICENDEILKIGYYFTIVKLLQMTVDLKNTLN